MTWKIVTYINVLAHRVEYDVVVLEVYERDGYIAWNAHVGEVCLDLGRAETVAAAKHAARAAAITWLREQARRLELAAGDDA